MTSLRKHLASAMILLLAGAVLIKGVDLIAAAHDMSDALAAAQTIAAAQTRGVKQGTAQIKDALSQLQRWLSRDGGASQARRIYAAIKAIDDSAGAEEELLNFLSVEPTSGEQWLELARLRAARRASVTQILKAAQISNVAAPREAEAMEARLPLLLQLWEVLPEDERRLTVNLLIELRGGANRKTRQGVKELLAAMPESERQTLAERVAARAGAEDSWRREVGLR